MSLANLSASEVQSIGGALQSPKDIGNREDVELQWAMKASNHADTYFNIITAVDPITLKLTKFDDEIYTKFQEEFKDFNVENLDIDKLKSEEAKVKWREFCEFFKEVEDYNYGTLLRLDTKKDYSESNTIFALRIQFLAIEIARNRKGCNSSLRITKGLNTESDKS